jgi:ethanolamine transporter
MSINEIILYIMMVFMVLGAVDKIFGNRFDLGSKFDEGFMAMGPLAIAMLGVVSIAPVLARVLGVVVVPVYTFLGADPAMFATTLLANDMGGYPLAKAMALTPQAGSFAGLILGAMMGPTIVFTIPVALGIIRKEDHKYLASGIMIGMVTIPLGCLAGGLAAGNDIWMIFHNLVPIVMFALVIAAGLWIAPGKMIRGFTIFGKGLMIFITICTVFIVLETLTGLVIIPGMTPIWDGMKIIGSISIVLIGAFPMVAVITRVFAKPLLKLGGLIGMNDAAAAGMIATLANAIPMLTMLKDMNPKGKIINIAFAVSAAFILGDHLGFTAGVEKEMIFPMIIGKFTGGVTAVVVAVLIGDRMTKSEGKEAMTNQTESVKENKEV